jgi:hypothetical protein
MSQSFGNITNSSKINPSSGYGKRPSPKRGASSNHKGIDLPYPSGTDITSPLDGIITAAQDTSPDGCGGLIKIDHGTVNGSKLVSKFCHVSGFAGKKVKDSVKQGDVVGKSGGGTNDPMKGTSTGSHIHFEVLKDGNNVDPTPYYNQSFSVTKQELPDLTDLETDDDDESDSLKKSVVQKTVDLFKPILKPILDKFSINPFNENVKLDEEIKRIKELLK